MTVHIQKLSSIADKLRELGQPVDNMQLVTKALATIPEKFRIVRSIWANVPLNERTIDNLLQRLRLEENVARSYENNVVTNQAAFPAYNHSRRNHNAGRGGNHRRDSNNHHSVRGTFNNHQSRRSDTRCGYCFIRGHETKDCRKKKRAEEAKKNESQDRALISSSSSDPKSTLAFFADSGATKHMSDQKHIFEEFTTIKPGTWSIAGIGDTHLEVLGKGSIRVITEINGVNTTRTINDVLYVPGLGTNLFSIGAATENGLEARFQGDRVFFYRGNSLILTGKRTGDTLYLLNLKPQIKLESANTTDHVGKAFGANLRASLTVWHKRLGHANYQNILKMASKDLAEGLNMTAERSIPTTLCTACERGKFHRQPLKKGRTRATRIGELVHSDVCGPMPHPSIGHARFYVLFTDDFSGWRVVFFMKNKSEVPAFFQKFYASLLNETGNTIRTLRSDNGGEYEGNEFKKYLAEKGIRHETSAVYTPAQNGVAERGNRTIMDGARSILLDSNLPPSLWAEAVAYLVYIRNRVLSSTGKITPFEAWNKRKPDLSNIRIFGSRAFVKRHNIRKLDARSEEGAFVGFSDTQKASRIFIPSTPPRVVVSHDVKIDETTMYRRTDKEEKASSNKDEETAVTEDMEVDDEIQTVPVSPMDNTTNNIRTHTPIQTSPMDNEDHHHRNSSEELYPATINHETEEPIADNIEVNNTENGSTENIQVVPESNNRRSSRQPRYSDRYLEYRKSLARQAITFGMPATVRNTKTNQSQPFEPSTYTEAVTCEDAEQWIPAIFEEYESLMQNDTWSLCALPPGRKAIKGKWIFKFKPGHKQVASRFKARFVVKGYSQIFGLDYVDTFAPVVKPSSLRTVLAIAAAKDLEMIQLDIRTAFLYGELQEEIYMEQPEGFIIPGKEEHVCRLLKSIYGLKQASRAWNRKFNDFILKFGLSQCQADPCVYFRHQRMGEEDEEFTILIIYVDDGIIFSNKKHILNDILDHLKTVFQIRTLPADRFIGVDITRNRPERSIYLSQPEYIQKITEKFNMTECNQLAIPADPSCRLSPDMSPQNKEEETEMLNTPFREAVGSLMHVMVMTRPDIAYAVGQVAQFAQNPGKQHWRAVKRILAYLKKTPNVGLRFNQTNSSLSGFCDADYAGDLQTRRSTSGFAFLYHGGPISWTSRRQQCVALSTTEAEFVAAAEATKEAVWLQQLLSEIYTTKLPTPLSCDNQSAIALVKNPAFHQRTKHIDVRLFYIREAQESGKVNIIYTNTEQQLADIFTKALAVPKFEGFREALGIVQIPI